MAVRRAMADIVRSLEDLQPEAVVLNAQVARDPTARERLMARIVTLGQSVNAVRDRFDQVVSTLPARQQKESRVDDLRRTLDALMNSVPRLSSGNTP